MGITIAVLTAFWGAVVMWANPRRRVNLLAFTMSIHVAIWILVRQLPAISPSALLWVRITMAIGAFFPAHLWIFLQSIATQSEEKSPNLLPPRAWIWLAASGILAGIVFSNHFIPQSATLGNGKIGPLYILHVVGLISSYSALIYYARRTSKSLKGVESLELNIVLIGGASAAIFILASALGKRLLALEFSSHLSPLIILFLFVGLYFAITTKRIFDAKHLLAIGLRAAGALLIATLVAYLFDQFARKYFGPAMTVLGSTMLALLTFRPVGRRLSAILDLLPNVSELRKAALEASQRAMSSSDLNSEFGRILQAWSQSEHIEIQSRATGEGSTPRNEASKFSYLEELVKRTEWLTPERLMRERRSKIGDVVLQKLRSDKIGLVVFRASPTSTLLIVISIRPSRQPFTYPETQLLLEIATIIEAGHARCILADRARDAERLATVGVLGAGVAHEIRNPLVTIKAFVQLLPHHYHNEDFRKRFSAPIEQEITRIEELTEQLLDLATPRKYVLEVCSLQRILIDLRDLIVLRTKERQVEVFCQFDASHDRILADAGAVRQIVLNLCINAIQAQEGQKTPRWIRIATNSTSMGTEVMIADNGPGIKDELRSRLFQTFQTTKSSGFGLGLAICGEIARNINARISLDDFVPGRGTTFRVLFPCQLSS